MKKEAIRAAVEAEIDTFAEEIEPLTVDEVRAIYAAEVEKYGPGRDAYQGLRTEVSAALQLKNPPPHQHDVEAAKGALHAHAKDTLHDEARASVSDEHRLLSDHARQVDPHHTDAHHFAQKLHGTALWREVDRVIAEAGITPAAGGAS